MIGTIIAGCMLIYTFRIIFLVFFPQTRVVEVEKDGEQGYVLEALSWMIPYLWTSRWFEWSSTRVTSDWLEEPCRIHKTPDRYLELKNRRTTRYKRIKVVRDQDNTQKDYSYLLDGVNDPSEILMLKSVIKRISNGNN